MERTRINVLSKLLSFIASNETECLTFIYNEIEMKNDIQTLLERIGCKKIVHYKRDEFSAVTFHLNPNWYEYVNVKF
jgi:hypothetical protein